MQAYISKPVTPVKVSAVQYLPPTEDVPGNIDELNEIAPTRTQVPWDPANGQNCVLVDLGPAEYVMVPGAYLVQHADGSLEVVEPEDFDATYDRVSDAPVVTGSAKPKTSPGDVDLI